MSKQKNKIPEGWREVSLRDIFVVINGLWTGKTADLVECKVLRNTNFLNSGKIDLADVALINVDKKSLVSRELVFGDIIVERSGGSDAQPVGRVINFLLNEKGYSFSNFTSCLRIVDKDKYNFSYLYFVLYNLWISRVTEQMQKRTTGIRNLDFDAYLNYKVLIPLLATQNKIAEILGAVDEGIEKVNSVIAKSEKLRDGYLDNIFNDKKSGWRLVSLNQVADVERGKFTHRPRNDPKFYGGDVPFIQTGDVVNCNGKITSYRQTLNDEGLKISKLFRKGTVVLTIAANIGDTGILEFDSCFPDSLVGITVREGMSNIFLEYYLRTKKQYLNTIATQSAQKNINLQKLQPLTVVKPPLKEQKYIADLLSGIDAKIAVYQRIKDNLSQLKKGLMADLLNGRKIL